MAGAEALDALCRKLRSQIGDDVQHIYDHEALFIAANDTITALSARLAEVGAERDALKLALDIVVNEPDKAKVKRLISEREAAEAQLAAAREDALREAAGFHKAQQSRWQKVIDADETLMASDKWDAVVANHSAYADAILALIDQPTPICKEVFK